MKSANAFYVASIAGLFGVLLAANPVFAEKMDCSGSKVAKEQISSESIKPGDRLDREMVQSVRVDIVSSRNHEFDGIETTVYAHLDHVGATGTHNGYSIYPLKSGEKLWMKWEGTHHLVMKGDAWEIPYQGVARFIAGTGKYKAIRGGGHYKGIVTATSHTEDFVCEAEF